jgi:hypothetical protein
MEVLIVNLPLRNNGQTWPVKVPDKLKDNKITINSSCNSQTPGLRQRLTVLTPRGMNKVCMSRGESQHPLRWPRIVSYELAASIFSAKYVDYLKPLHLGYLLRRACSHQVAPQTNIETSALAEPSDLLSLPGAISPKSSLVCPCLGHMILRAQPINIPKQFI